jgi:hypothetical protein
VSNTGPNRNRVLGRSSGTAPVASHSATAFLDGGIGIQIRIDVSPRRTA